MTTLNNYHLNQGQQGKPDEHEGWGRCHNCVHWRQLEDRVYGICHSPKQKVPPPTTEEALEHVIDVGEDEVWLCFTGPMFGCCHFE